MQGIRHHTAIAARMQILDGGPDTDLEAAIAPASDIDAGQIRPPARAVGREHGIGLQQLAMRLQGWPERRASAFLLALEIEPHIDRQPPLDLQERDQRFECDQQRPFVIRHTTRIDPAIAFGGLEWRGTPQLQGVGRLYVVMAIDQKRRRSGGTQPLGVDGGMARSVRRQQASNARKAGLLEPLLPEIAARAPFHRRNWRRCSPRDSRRRSSIAPRTRPARQAHAPIPDHSCDTSINRKHLARGPARLLRDKERDRRSDIRLACPCGG